jgi:hypothetical protein
MCRNAATRRCGLPRRVRQAEGPHVLLARRIAPLNILPPNLFRFCFSTEIVKRPLSGTVIDTDGFDMENPIVQSATGDPEAKVSGLVALIHASLRFGFKSAMGGTSTR